MKDNNKVTDEGVSLIARNLVNLNRLDIGENRVSNEVTRILGRGLKKLIRLFLCNYGVNSENNTLDNNSLHAFSQYHPQLQFLWLKMNSFT